AQCNESDTCPVYFLHKIGSYLIVVVGKITVVQYDLLFIFDVRTIFLSYDAIEHKFLIAPFTDIVCYTCRHHPLAGSIQNISPETEVPHKRQAEGLVVKSVQPSQIKLRFSVTDRFFRIIYDGITICAYDNI